MHYRTIKLESEADLATLTLNRPDKRNALSPAMMEEVLVALDEVEKSRTRVLILTGAGKAFCAGMDLEALKALAVAPAFRPAGLEAEARQEAAQDAGLKAGATEAHIADSRRTATMFRRIYAFPKPVFAAVNGPAIAGGCGMATLCDYTLAAPDAKFGYTEVRIGFIPALVSVFLIRQIGEKRARDLLLSGRLLAAEEARQMGLVTEVVPPERLLERARELAGALLELSPTSLTYTKRLLRELSERELDRELEMAIHENARIRSTADFREGLTAFLEKRKPQWRGQ
jgi:methylglutaconyl-CoA hydratase